jgi:hypothetical protein
MRAYSERKAFQEKRDSPLGRAPLHQHRRDEGQGREEDTEEEERQTSMEDIDILT